ncbi:MAG: TauD/TfdA family dioxygenase [Cyclobacteriaceae bacterium]
MKSDLLKKLLDTKTSSISPDREHVQVTIPKEDTSDLVRITPAIESVNLSEWMQSHKNELREKLSRYGGILFRSFELPEADAFRTAFRHYTGNLIDYTYRTSPRTEISNNIYTSTDYPSDQLIRMHTESSYAPEWPLHLAFYCLIPPGAGGETPVVDMRKVLHSLQPETRHLFEEKGVMYIRNMKKNLGLSWQEVYQTDDRKVVEDFCINNGIQYEWVSDDHLRICWTRPAIHTHPVSGDKTWFNHAYFYHKRYQDNHLLQSVPADQLPFTSRFGNGEEIPTDVIEEVGQVIQEHTITFPWQKGDMLLLDNMLMGHSRNPYEGDRKILVAMADPIRHDSR